MSETASVQKPKKKKSGILYPRNLLRGYQTPAVPGKV
jgi:hypothetical protein